ncbi:MAG: HlyC/CorC family transporter [Oscillospiraceae bacterium]|nr:HlyC/CorC family transporter [Oscillospiraceae bacterium]
MIYLLYLLLVLLVLLSAFFSSSEIAYATASRLRLQNDAENGSKRAARAMWITEHFTGFLSTILVGNNLVNIAFSSAMTALMVNVYGASGEAIAPIASTMVLLIFGEIIPKIAGTSQADRLVRVYTYPLRFFMILFKPVTALVTRIVNRLSKLWTSEEAEPEVTDEELVSILETIEDEGVFTEQESELIKSAIEFSDVTAGDIFIPRVDVTAIDAEDSVEDLLKDEDLLSYSRIPVYRDTIDTILGILSTKKLLKAAITTPLSEIRLEDLLSPPVYVHKTRTISSILSEFRKKHLMMAIVVDEYGGTEGILTLEDILEEIVGDIFDESDDIELDVEQKSDNVYVVDGGTTIEDFFDSIDYRPEHFESEYSTMGGWAIEMLDRFPQKGDHFTWDRFSVTVTEAEARRVETLEVELLPPPEEE